MDSARPLRLLVAGLSWPAETFLERLLVGLALSGVEVVVASPRRPSGMPVQWISAPSWRGTSPVRLLRSVGSAAAAWVRSPAETKMALDGDQRAGARRQVRALHDLAPPIGRDWDVLYFPWNSAAAAHLPLFEAGKPVVVSCRGSQILVAPTNPRRSREVERYLRALDKATAVHCVCDAVRLSVEAKGIGPTKISVISPGIDT
ncbi:MAG: glycosyltransferase family 4 protein, partial [Thermoanaerobaculia bacterium]